MLILLKLRHNRLSIYLERVSQFCRSFLSNAGLVIFYEITIESLVGFFSSQRHRLKFHHWSNIKLSQRVSPRRVSFSKFANSPKRRTATCEIEIN